MTRAIGAQPKRENDMANKGSQEELTLRRMPDGGFLVLLYPTRGEERHTWNLPFAFASTDIDGALKYMRGQINPVEATAKK